MKIPGFIGPSYQSRSLAVDAQRTMNLYQEIVESGTGKAPKALFGRPGIQLFATLAQTPVRGVWAGENRLFAVGGSHFYELTTGTPVDRSALSGATTIGNDGNPVQFVVNGNQVGLASAGDFYCDSGSGPVAVGFTGSAGTSTTSLTVGSGSKTVTTQSGLPYSAGARIRISSSATPSKYMVGTCTSYSGTTLVVNVTQFEGSGTLASWNIILPVPAVQCAYLDGYFIAQNAYNSKQWNLSSILDGTTWSQLDFALKEGYPDSLSAILADHEEVYLFGVEGTAEVWRDIGAPPPAFPFQRDPGAFMHYGCLAPYSPVRLNNGVAWIAGDASANGRGGPFAVYAQGYQPNRVSTHAVEEAWSSYSKFSDAVSFSLIENGNHLWIIGFPTANATWCYNATANDWTEWGWWNGSGWDRLRGAFHCYVDIGSGPQHFVGDWQNGKVYTMSPALSDDDGTAIYWQRTAPYLEDEEKRIFSHRLQLNANQGLKCWLEFSDDNAGSWSNKKYPRPAVSVPKGGVRYIWARLGAGMHRLFRITGTGGGNSVALIDAYLRSTEGES
jgi:hypothetical protein